MELHFKPRITAFVVHLSASAFVCGLIFAIILLVLYPQPLLQAQGVLAIFIILLLVDVVAGPTLTFLVYNPVKKSLKFDLAVIVALQLGALLYGLNAVYQGRPVYLVFNVDRFSVVTAADLVFEEGEAPNSQYMNLPKWGPEMIGAKRPESRSERTDLLFSSVFGGRDLDMLPQYYAPIEEFAGEIKGRLRPLSELEARGKPSSAQLAAAAEKHGLEKDQLGYLPVVGKTRDFIALIARQDASVLQFLAIEPVWQ